VSGIGVQQLRKPVVIGFRHAVCRPFPNESPVSLRVRCLGCGHRFLSPCHVNRLSI
jgi:hypothetical protein